MVRAGYPKGPDDPIDSHSDSEICPACGSTGRGSLVAGTDRLFGTTHQTFQVVACTDCGLIRLYPWPAPHEISRLYPRQYWFAPGGSLAGRLEELYRRLVLRDHIDFVERALFDAAEENPQAPGPVLDVGCGGGLFLRLLQERGHRVAGLDFSSEAASLAWHQNGVPTVCASLSESPVTPRSCRAVTMFHVLEHLLNPVAYLKSAHELLQSEGRLIVQVPNADCWQFLLMGSRWNGIDIPRHLVNYRRRDIDNLLDYCDFEVLRHKHFNLRDNPAGMATSLLPWLDPMSRRVRGVPERLWQRLLKDGFYLSLTAACVLPAMLEAACGTGSTLMVEARKKKR